MNAEELASLYLMPFCNLSCRLKVFLKHYFAITYLLHNAVVGPPRFLGNKSITLIPGVRNLDAEPYLHLLFKSADSERTT
jgi:hypothetical protein